jgi:hypothetical protein
MTAAKEREVERKVAALAGLDRRELSERWRSAFGTDAPPRTSRALMVKAIAHEIQVTAFGGHSARTLRALRAATKSDGGRGVRALPGRGSRLIREWNGTLHEVEVLEDGYLWNGQSHRSLSSIAKAITGTKWSGPRFFGLKDRS